MHAERWRVDRGVGLRPCARFTVSVAGAAQSGPADDVSLAWGKGSSLREQDLEPGCKTPLVWRYIALD